MEKYGAGCGFDRTGSRGNSDTGRTGGAGRGGLLGFFGHQCSRKDDCAALKLWEELDKAIGGVVDHYTLEDLLKRQDEESDR